MNVTRGKKTIKETVCCRIFVLGAKSFGYDTLCYFLLLLSHCFSACPHSHCFTSTWRITLQARQPMNASVKRREQAQSPVQKWMMTTIREGPKEAVGAIALRCVAIKQWWASRSYLRYIWERRRVSVRRPVKQASTSHTWRTLDQILLILT